MSRLNELSERHAILLDKLVNNTGRPKGEKPGMWPCQCYDEIRLLIGNENFNEISNSVAKEETCHDRRSKLTLFAANNRFHTIKSPIKEVFIAQFAQFGKDLRAYKVSLENNQKKK